ncbi:hypothetical protein D3C87_1597400 [compost metagenome]
MNARAEGKLRLVGFQEFVETAFEMKYHFRASVGHSPVEVGFGVGEVVFQDPEEADVPSKVGWREYCEIFHELAYLVYLR